MRRGVPVPAYLVLFVSRGIAWEGLSPPKRQVHAVQHFTRLAVVVSGALLIVLVARSSGLVALARTATVSTCTEVIGFSETQQWYDGVGTPGANGNGGFIGSIA